MSLRALAAQYGVQSTYGTIGGGRASASAASVAAVLRALGAPVDDDGRMIDDVPGASRIVEPVTVAWEGQPASVVVRASDVPRGRVECALALESGERIGLAGPPAPEAGPDGAAYAVPLPQLPRGYHRLEVQQGGQRATSLVLAAPTRCFGDDAAPGWGIFAPAYALRDAETLGFGSVRELGAFGRWAASHGASLLGTLPLLAGDLARDPSPYRPISRLFWNESYADVSRFDMPEPIRAELRDAAATEIIDYARTVPAMRTIADDSGLADESAGRGVCPSLADYARFRAAGERHSTDWRRWPDLLRDGTIGDDAVDQRVVRYHLFAQALIGRQMAELRDDLRSSGTELHLDLPLGVHPDGYDAWRYRSQFIDGCSTGAPADDFIARGQNWAFPPPHPKHMRDESYAYLIGTLRHHMQHAGLLRIDHVMGLHRLFVIPDGFDARDGAYVRYHADELYAILAIESHRNRCAVVGENLGTVPGYVNLAMKRHGLYGMHVAAFRSQVDDRGRLRAPQGDRVASMNTHDIFPFAGFWCERDIDDRLQRGLLHAQAEAPEREVRSLMRERVCRALDIDLQPRTPDGAAHVLRAWLGALSSARAHYVMVNAEDLWCEEEPQNRPGTAAGFPNWRRRFRRSIEQIATDADVAATLAAVAGARPRRGSRT